LALPRRGDPVTQRIWIRLNGEGMLAEWDPSRIIGRRARGLEHKTWFDQPPPSIHWAAAMWPWAVERFRTYDLSSPGSIIQRDIGPPPQGYRRRHQSRF
jgi:hypothetical protein